MMMKHLPIILNTLFFGLLYLWHFCAWNWQFKLDEATGLFWLMYIGVNGMIFVIYYECIDNVEVFMSPIWTIIQTIQWALLPIMSGTANPIIMLIAIVVGVSLIRDWRIWTIYSFSMHRWREWKKRDAERKEFRRRKLQQK